MYNKQKLSLRIHVIKWFDSRNKPWLIRSFVWSQDLFQTAIFIFTSCHFPSWCYLTATKYSRPFWRNTDILQHDLWSSLSTKAKVVAIDSPRVWPTASTELYRGIHHVGASSPIQPYFLFSHILSLVIPQHETPIYDQHLF